MKSKKKEESLKKDLLKDELLSEDTKAAEEQAVNINEFTSGLNFEHSVEKYKDNMSTAITFLLCGIGGIVFLILNWFKVIKVITGRDTQSMVIYISFTVLFVIFIGIAIYSLKAAKKVKNKIKSEADYTEDIRAWVDSHIIPEVVDASFDSEGVPSELKYFERSAFITKAVKTEFPDAPNDLVDNIVDEYIEEMFHVIERALAEEAAAKAEEEEEYEDEVSDSNNETSDDSDDADDTDNE